MHWRVEKKTATYLLRCPVLFRMRGLFLVCMFRPFFEHLDMFLMTGAILTTCWEAVSLLVEWYQPSKCFKKKLHISSPPWTTLFLTVQERYRYCSGFQLLCMFGCATKEPVPHWSTVSGKWKLILTQCTINYECEENVVLGLVLSNVSTT